MASSPHVVDLALVRHGETEWNRLGRYQGGSDIPLNDTGRQQARAAAQALASFPAVRLVASPLSRAQETARIIGEPHGLSITDTVPELAERAYGAAEGLEDAVAIARWPDHNYPGAETEASVAARGVAALNRLLDDDLPAIVVAHGTVLRLALSALTGTAVPRLVNAKVLILSRDPAGRAVLAG